MKLVQLEALVAIADQGSFCSAAISLNVKQPTLTRHVKNLEDELGIRLFERSVYGSILTKYGEEVTSRARTLIKDVDALKATARNFT